MSDTKKKHEIVVTAKGGDVAIRIAADDPGVESVLYTLGQFFTRQGRHDDAQQCLAAVEELRSATAKARVDAADAPKAAPSSKGPSPAQPAPAPATAPAKAKA